MTRANRHTGFVDAIVHDFHSEKPVATLMLDALEWDPDGVDCPSELIAIEGDGRKFDPFYWRDHHSRTWQAICRGETGKAAKAAAIFLEEKEDAFDGKEICVGDVLWWGCIDRNRRGSFKGIEEGAGVVVEITDVRLVLTKHATIAKAVAEAKLRRSALQVNAHLADFRAQWKAAWIAREERELEEERNRRPSEPPSDEDMDAIGAIGV